jgi:hypothetical protein
MSNITSTTAAVFAAFKGENKAACKTDAALIAAGTAYATAMDEDSIGATAILAEIAALPAAIKVTDASLRKAMGLPTNVALVYGLAHVGRMVSTTVDGTESLVGFDVRLAWKMASAIANEEKLGGGVAALSATLGDDVDDVFEAFDALVALDRAVKDARNAAKKAAAAGSTGGSSDDESDESESSLSDSESTPSSANRWASVLAVLTALAADAAGMTEADMAAHAQATAILAEMVPASTTPSSPAGIEIVFPDVFVPA